MDSSFRTPRQATPNQQLAIPVQDISTRCKFIQRQRKQPDQTCPSYEALDQCDLPAACQHILTFFPSCITSRLYGRNQFRDILDFIEDDWFRIPQEKSIRVMSGECLRAMLLEVDIGERRAHMSDHGGFSRLSRTIHGHCRVPLESFQHFLLTGTGDISFYNKILTHECKIIKYGFTFLQQYRAKTREGIPKLRIKQNPFRHALMESSISSRFFSRSDFSTVSTTVRVTESTAACRNTMPDIQEKAFPHILTCRISSATAFLPCISDIC